MFFGFRERKSKMRLLCLTIVAVACLASSARSEVYVSGHADIGVEFENNSLHLHLHAENPLGLFGGGTKPAGEYDAGEVIIGVPNPSAARPAGTQWNFLAPNAGDLFWSLPQSSNPAKPFLGLGTEELLPSDGWSTLTWTFNSITTVSGDNSQFSLWQSNELGVPTVVASTLTPVNSANGVNSWTQNALSHDHYNFGFTGVGVYDVSFTIRGAKTGDNAGNYSDTAAFRFAVGDAIATVPEPSSLLLAGWVVAGSILYRRRAI
jgi:surface-anchored protein